MARKQNPWAVVETWAKKQTALYYDGSCEGMPDAYWRCPSCGGQTPELWTLCGGCSNSAVAAHEASESARHKREALKMAHDYPAQISARARLAQIAKNRKRWPELYLELSKGSARPASKHDLLKSREWRGAKEVEDLGEVTFEYVISQNGEPTMATAKISDAVLLRHPSGAVARIRRSPAQ